LKTGLHTGKLGLRFRGTDDNYLEEIAMEVRSRKLDYLAHYRWMLDDIANASAELLQENFAPTDQQFATNESVNASTLYQKFVFLRSLVCSGRLQDALHRICSQPYIQWETVSEEIPLGRPARCTGSLAKSFCRAGPRIDAPGFGISLPLQLTATMNRETFDNEPNRFVRHALEQWLALIDELRLVLFDKKDSTRTRRGLGEVDEVSSILESFLATTALRAAGPLRSFPSSNQVLQKKAAYREVLGAYVLFEFGAKLAWDGGEDIFGGGQKNVATLYELWTFIQLARIITEIAGGNSDLAHLIKSSRDGTTLLLKTGTASRVKATASRWGRRFQLELTYNQTFKSNGGSWTRAMRPDCTLKVSSKDEDWEPLLIHFDAKYRIDEIKNVLDMEGEKSRSTAKGDDLLKMHAYRDAIHQAVGAYVLYPGTETVLREKHQELLPGLGAFPLSPSSSGLADGSEAIRGFLERILTHVATDGSHHKRARYWAATSYRGPRQVEPTAWTLGLGATPPADARVLLGFVREGHLDWVREQRIYNLRADGRTGGVGLTSVELSSEWIILYGPDAPNGLLGRVAGATIVMTGENLRALGYTEPRGELYLCLPLQLYEGAPLWPDKEFGEVVKKLAPSSILGAPHSCSWLDIIKSF
ncbi:MAG: DUF2357 domain-containing protein, partial [Deltaproteobacteria bacterium]|nr:DUF2357 domain-containing protein [Deltaproteobacteria bacterium]